MTTPPPDPDPPKPENLVDEAGHAIEAAEEKIEHASLEAATAVEERVGDAGPWVWWRLGVIAVAILIALLLFLQFRGGYTGSADAPAAPQATTPAK
jgi:hypothetical protein